MKKREQKYSRAFCLIAAAGLAGPVAAYPGLTSDSSSSSDTSSVSTSSRFAPAPQHGKTEVTIGDVKLSCTNSTGISFGVGVSQDRYFGDQAGLDDSESLSFGVTLTHILGANKKQCEQMARRASRQVETNNRIKWFDTVRTTCKEDLAPDMNAGDMLDYFKALSATILGHDDPFEAEKAVRLCSSMQKGTGAAKPVGPRYGGH